MTPSSDVPIEWLPAWQHQLHQAMTDAGLDAFDLTRTSPLSLAQVRELLGQEHGSLRSQFYSERIKCVVGHRLLTQLLGR